MFSYFKFFFKEYSFLFFFSLIACGQDISILPSTLAEKDPSFFQNRKETDPDRIEIFKRSYHIYHGGKKCISDPSCVKICDQIFSLDLDKKDCAQLSQPQVDRFEKLYGYLLEKDQASLNKIEAFDLRVFLNVSPQPLLQILRTLGPVSVKTFLIWLIEDWKVGEVFYREDFDFLFLEIFLNEMDISPINSLKEKVSENRTFFELSWVKQNDFVLFWLSDYFEKQRCSHFEGEQLENCILGQYCQISSGFQKGFKEEIMSFENLKVLLNERKNYPQEDLGSFCSAFCSKDQEYC